jgi:uncharacterized protein (DUF1330 family)
MKLQGEAVEAAKARRHRYPSVDAVLAWRHDPAYEAVRRIGEKYAKYRTFAVEGSSK